MKFTTKAFSGVLLFALVLLFPILSIQYIEAANDSWTTKMSMPAAVVGHGAAVVDGKLYIIGGSNYDVWVVNTTLQYDPSLDTWSKRASMPTARSNFGIAVYENKIYCIGGDVGTYKPVPTGIVEVYDPATDTWETKTSMPTARYDLTANVVKDKIYLIGGFDFIGPYSLNITEVYNPEIDTWTTKAQMPVGVMSHSSAVVNDKIYVLAGRVYTDTSGYDCNFTQIYDAATDTWRFGSQIPKAVTYAAAAATTGTNAPKLIYVIGGRQELDAFNFVQIYNPSTNSWSAATSMPTARCRLAVANINNQLYAIGGLTGWFEELTAVNEQFTPKDYQTPSDFPMLAILSIVVLGILLLSILFKKMHKK
jgi:N-acetylneuraminic acid mutarotase